MKSLASAQLSGEAKSMGGLTKGSFVSDRKTGKRSVQKIRFAKTARKSCGYKPFQDFAGGQTNALSPVMAFPTIKVFISRVPSYE
jgi:hypothetical protein